MTSRSSLALAIALPVLLSSIPLAGAAENTDQLFDKIQMELKLSDITDHKNEEAIIYLYKHNIIGGYPDGTFRPDGTINRAELLKILVGDKVASLDVMDEGGKPHPEYQNCFPDVHEEWFAVSICFAKKQGWISGYPDGTFRPSQSVTKAEAVKMLVSIEGFTPSAQASPFDDVQEGDWYAPFIQAAYAKNLLELPRKGFASNPYGAGEAITRGSVGESMYRVAVIKERGADSYMATEDLPERTQLTTGNLFPINLVDNQKWKIEVWRTESEYFTVERDEDQFTVKRYEINASTGKTQIPYRGNEYNASFNEFSTIDGTALIIQECHFRYEYIREDIMCDQILLPAVIPQKTIHGYSAQFSDSTGQDYTVKISSKAKEDIPCNVKARSVEGEQIYYLPDSEVMKKDAWSGVFKCFASEQDAIKAGYKKSYK